MRVAAVASLVALSTVAVLSGAPQDRPVFRGGVRLIDVDVVATDKNGAPVRDLTAGDFEILEDGRAQEIRAFALVDLPVAPRPSTPEASGPEIEPDVTTNAGPDGRLYVILMDAPSTAYPQSSSAEGYGYTMRGKQVALDFVRTAVQPGDEVAVVHVQGTFADGQPFTTNRHLIEASIDRYGRGLSGTDSFDVKPKSARARDTFRAIEDLSVRLGTIRGRRKAVIWIGGQINSDGAADDVSFDYREALRAAARNNVVIYPIDPSGVSTESGEAELSRMSGLRSVAEGTGGLAVVNTSNFAGGFAAVVQDLSTYYLLGYSPDRDNKEGSFHSISVRVKRPGVTVRARTGYYAGPATESARTPRKPLPKGVSTAVVDALARPLPTKDLRIDVFTSSFKTPRRERSVIIGARVDAYRLHLDPGASVLLAYQVLNNEGHVVTGNYKVFSLDLKQRTREIVVDRGLQFLDRVALRPGRYELRLAAEQAGVALGSVIADISVPEFDGPLGMSDVVLAASGQTTTALAGDPPLREALTADPTVLRRFTTRDTVLAFAEVYAERPDDVARVAGTLATTAGGEVARGAVSTIAPMRGAEATARGSRVAFDLRAVPPGQYILTIEAKSQRRKDRSVRQQIPVVVEP